MTPIEIFALIFAIVGCIKIIVILVKPASWMNLAKGLWKSSLLTGIICLILALVVLNYLLVELTIVQIFAVMMFVALLAGVSVAAYSKEILDLGTKMLKNKAILRKAWPSLIIWIVLIVWVLSVLLG